MADMIRYIYPRDSDEDDLVEDEDCNNLEDNRKMEISYDTSLPAQHSYLGVDLEEVSGRTVLDDNSCQQLPILTFSNIVLVPGQTLPLQLFDPAVISTMKIIIDKDKTFGIIKSPQVTTSNVTGIMIDAIGTTAEIRSYREDVDEMTGISNLRVKAEGRQRFKVLETWRQTNGIIMAKVEILPEIILEDMGSGARLPTLDRFRVPPVQGKTPSKTLHRKYKHNFANYTHWPPWVYEQYDTAVIMKKIWSHLKAWNQSLPEDATSQNVSTFSFWVAANLPLDDTIRLSLLAFNSPIQRLRCEAKLLEKCTVLCCQECSRHIADNCDIFSMSLEGPQGTYVNPIGYVHETITVRKALGLTLRGTPSTEFSWFPGYAWTIVECSNCHNHLGWKFTTRNKKLLPEKFWGLCRSSVQAGIVTNDWTPVV